MTSSDASFAGISGESNPGRGTVTMPISLPSLSACSFEADVVGDQGSYCPGLLPNSAMRKYNMSLFANMFSDGDGILVVVPRCGDEVLPGVLIRVLLTESGHYLLPTDGKTQSTPHEQNVMKKLIKAYTKHVTCDPRETTLALHSDISAIEPVRVGSSQRIPPDKEHRTVSFQLPDDKGISDNKIFLTKSEMFYNRWKTFDGRKWSSDNIWPKHFDSNLVKLNEKY